MTTFEFWFDFSCPYAFLASKQVERVAAEAGATIIWQPMLLGGVFAGIGAGEGPMKTLSEARKAYVAKDLQRWARIAGVSFTTPVAHPMRTVLALRSLLGLPKEHWPRAAHALFDAYWLRHQDITQPQVVEAVLAAACGDKVLAANAVATSDTDAIKDTLRAQTSQAVAHGIFGAPAFRVLRAGQRGEPMLIWGQDRLAHLAASLRGWDGIAAPTTKPKPFSPAAAPTTLHYYFDFSSPFAYLGATQARRIASELGANLVWRPFLLGGLFRTIGTSDVPLLEMPEAKRRYYMTEQHRWAAWWGVPFNFPKAFPMKTTKPLRITLAVLDAADPAKTPASSPEQIDAWIAAVYQAYWVRGENLDDDLVMSGCLAQAGLPATLLTEAASDLRKQQLIEATQGAAALGVFGAPTIAVERDGRQELVWGQDRWDLVALLAKGLTAT